jgi:hypothetical protein
LQWAKISEPNDLFGKMLAAPAHPLCPEELRGVFWQRDSSDAETMLTFQEAHWEHINTDGHFGLKPQIYNWTFVPIWWSAKFNSSRANLKLPINASPSGKWLNFGGGQYAYHVQPGDEFFSEEGARIDYIRPGDWMRIDWVDEADPSKGVSWQYLVQRVAFLNDEGELVTTEHYDTLLELARMPSPSCCNCFACVCCPEAKRRLDQLQNDAQMLFPASAPSQMDMTENPSVP